MDFKKYEELASKYLDLANKMYSKVTFIQVAEVINGEVNISSLDEACRLASRKVLDLKIALRKEVDSIPEDEYFDKYEDEHSRIDDLYYLVDDKLSAVEDIISALEKIKEKAEDSNFAKIFSDIHSINIEESIQLGRLSFKR